MEKTLVSSASIHGGAGSDSINFAYGLTSSANQKSANVYYYSGGTDTLNFAVAQTNAQGSYHTAIAGQEMRAVALPALSRPPRPVCKLCRHFV